MMMVRLKRAISLRPGLIFLFAVLPALFFLISPARPQDLDRLSILPGDDNCASDNSPDRHNRELQLDLRGLVSAWGAFSRADSNLAQLGTRFLPEFTLAVADPSGEAATSTLAVESSLNLWGMLTIQQGAENQFRGKIKPYRLSLKYATSRFEARLGLQKISFGSASLLRPLMWFDRLDPRDPIQLTDGVYGLLLRTYISSRTNLWAWTLYGNNEPKGWEALATSPRRPEFGSRVQIPVGPGELALTVHHRRVQYDLTNPAAALLPVLPGAPLNFSFPETRLAADGKWDLGPGLWFEAALTNQHSPHLAFRWQRALTLGMDYTFAVGNGLHLLGEYFQSDLATGILSRAIYAPFRARFLAASVSYPLTFIDQLSAILFYDTLNRDLYNFIRWQRTYDRWSIHLMAFWNPAEFRIFSTSDQTNLFAGKGLQLLLIYTF